MTAAAPLRTLASNLAMSLARAGRKTLLIDCDLRSPAAHQLFEQPLQPGFSEVMLHEVETGKSLELDLTWVLPDGSVQNPWRVQAAFIE